MPNVNWNDDKLNVNWTNVDNRNPNLRARVTVSGMRAPFEGLFSLQVREPSMGHLRRLNEFFLQGKVFTIFDNIQLLAQPYEAFRDVDVYAQSLHRRNFLVRFHKCRFDGKRHAFKRCMFDARIQSKSISFGHPFARLIHFLIYIGKRMDNRSQDICGGGGSS